MKPILILMPTLNRPQGASDACAELFRHGTGLFDLLILQGDGGPGRVMNAVSSDLIGQYEIVGIVADDIRVRTPSWDRIVLDNLHTRRGVVYGRDGIQDERICTHPFISSQIIMAMGFISPPGLHFYADNFWMEVARAHQALFYVPELFTEHMHYTTGKSAHDATYQKGESNWPSDNAAWPDYRQRFLASDIQRVRAAFHP